MRVIIAGVGIIGGQLVADLTSAGGRELVLVDTDGSRCEELADEFDALVIHGDAANPEILDKAQITQADAIVATTGSDAVNAVIAMLAHRSGVGKIVVKLTTHALRGALDEIGISDVVAPTVAAAAMIDAALQGVERRDLALLAEGGLELAELQVGSKVDGRHVGDLDIPEQAMVVAVLQQNKSEMARPDTQLSEGDVLLVIAESEDAAEEARRRISDT